MKKFWPPQRWLLPHSFPAALFALGIALAVAGTWWLSNYQKNKLETEFLTKTERVTAEIQNRFSTPIHGLNGSKNLFSLDANLSAAQFKMGMADRQLSEEFPGVRGFGFIEAVKASDSTAFIEQQKKENHLDFQLQEFTPNQGSQRYIVKYFVTPNNLHGITGTDFATEAKRKAAIETAIASGKPSASDLVYIPPKEKKNTSLLIFVPVFSAAPANDTRPRTLLGLVFAPVAIAELLAHLPDIEKGDICYRIANLDADDSGTITQFDGHARDADVEGAHSPMFSHTRIFTLHQNQFRITVTSTELFESGLNRSIPVLFFFASSIIIALIAVLLQSQSSWSEQTQRKLDIAVRDNQALLNTLNMCTIVSITDHRGCIIEVNDAFCRISGFQRNELIGQNHKINQSKEQGSEFWELIWATISAGTPWRGEVCNRSKDGLLYWLDTFIAPFKNEQDVIERYISICTDITQSKKAAQQLQIALRDSDALLSTLNLHAIVSIANSTGRIIDVNHAYCRISGYTREEIIEGNHRIVATGIQSPDFLSEMWRTISAGTPWRGEVCNRTKEGKLYWVDTFIAPFKDINGHIEKYISIRTDITASKKTARRLANQRSALANIIEGTNVGTWEWNVETGEIRLNDRWANQVGYELNELAPTTIHTWDELTHPDDLQEAKMRMQRHFQNELPYYECETRLRHKDGHWIWVLTRGRISSFTPFNQPEWVSGTHMDITERKNAEAELQRSTQLLLTVRDQLTKAAEVAELGIWSWDVRSNEMIFNDRMFEIYEVSPKLREFKLSYEFWRSRVHPDDLEEAEERLQGAIAGTHTYSPIFRIINPSGGIRYIQAAAGVERDRHGHALLVTGINRDITLQYQAEETLRKAKQSADEASQAKSAFLANMSHEIRTPMNAVLGMLTLLRKTPLSAQQNDYARKAEGAARSLLNLLNDILDISKVEAGKMSLDPHPFEIHQLLNDISDLLSINADDKPVNLVFDIDPAVPQHLHGDAMRLRQVLTNLGSNAVKFTEHGEVRISVKQLKREHMQTLLQFSVRDTGIGIAPENQTKIFDGFTQAEASTTRRFGGSGLGIAISQGLINLMGGTLNLESELGQGSHFYFVVQLPIAAQADLFDEAHRIPQHDFQVLITEPNIFVRERIKLALQELPCETEFVDNNYVALQTIQAKGHTQLATLIDWDTIELDGWDVIHSIHDIARHRGQKLILIISENDYPHFQRSSPAAQSIFNDVLVKPISAPKLIRSLAAHSEPNYTSLSQDSDANQLPLLGLHILLVEDNINNQQIARELLEIKGAAVTVAQHGLDAIQKLTHEKIPCDLVLMDLQMPIMDGYTATHKIRAELGLHQLPIIAMSANVLAADKEAGIAAGLNDHIDKPFDIDDLIHIILQYTKKDTHQLTTQVKASPTIAPDLLDFAAQRQIDLPSALKRIDGKLDIYLRMINAYCKDLEIVPAHLDARSLKQLHTSLRHLHTIKGLAATLGASQDAHLFAQLERELSADLSESEAQEKLQRASTHIAALKLRLEQLAFYIHDSAQLMPPAIVFPDFELDPRIIHESLRLLYEQLDNADMAATETIVHILRLIGAPLPERLQQLEQAIAALDFSLAQQHCADLLENTL